MVPERGENRDCATLRLFIAINFTRKTKNGLVALQDTLRARSKRGNFTLPENLHVTLSFLGGCDPKQAAAAKAVTDSMQFEAFDISIERVGCFGRGRGNLWWAGVNEGEALLDLHRRLTDRLACAGFEPEKRRYSPHVTLGQQVVTDAAPWPVEPFGETVRKIHLMRSERINGKSAYTPI